MTDTPFAEQYAALRRGAGAYRLAVDVVAVRGPEATAYLQGQLSQDLAPVGVGGSRPSLLLQPDGKLCALVRATRTGEDAWALDTAGGFGGVVLERLRKYRLRVKAEIEPLEWPCVALRGADVDVASLAARRAGLAADGAAGPWVLDVQWNGTGGADLLGPGADGLVPPGATWCGDAAWEALRVEAGIPAMGAELDGKTIAAEAGLVERTVSFTKGCYTGQELVARLDARGNRVPRRLCGVVVPGLAADDAPSLVGGALAAAGREDAGRCTSAAWCPGLDEGRGAVGALAYLHRSVELPASLWCRPGVREADERGHDRPLEVRAVALPLVAGQSPA